MTAVNTRYKWLDNKAVGTWTQSAQSNQPAGAADLQQSGS
jgi:hypothetical protein